MSHYPGKESREVGFSLPPQKSPPPRKNATKRVSSQCTGRRCATLAYLLHTGTRQTRFADVLSSELRDFVWVARALSSTATDLVLAAYGASEGVCACARILVRHWCRFVVDMCMCSCMCALHPCVPGHVCMHVSPGLIAPLMRTATNTHVAAQNILMELVLEINAPMLLDGGVRCVHTLHQSP